MCSSNLITTSTKEATHTDAAAVCAAQGDRLCTREQLNQGRCCGTGCKFNIYKVWSSTPCSGAQAQADRAAESKAGKETEKIIKDVEGKNEGSKEESSDSG